MIRIFKLGPFLAVFLAMSGCLVYGETFYYSYQPEGVPLVTGTFDGTRDGNLITDISSVTLYFGGVSIGDNIQIYAPFSIGPAVVSIDGTQNDFGFFSGGEVGVASFSRGGGLAPVFVGYDLSLVQIVDSSVGPSWMVSDSPIIQPIPDGSETAVLLAFSVVGLALFVQEQRTWRKSFACLVKGRFPR